MSACENILLIRLKSIGDLIFTLPAVHAVRENFPSARITFLTSAENAALLQGFREVDEVIPLDRAALRSANPMKMGVAFFGLLRRLRAGKFDLVVDFQGYGETAWLSRWTGAPERWGSVYGKGRAWAYTKGIQRGQSPQNPDWNLSLLKQCGLKINRISNEYVLPTDALEAARRFFAANQLDPERQTLFIQALTSSAGKNWPLENYLSLAAHWREQGVQIIFGGGPRDLPTLEPARVAGHCIAAGNPLLVSAGLVKLSTVTIGGDTGLLHLAVAMQKRVIMLIRPTGEHELPYLPRDWRLSPESGENVAKIQIPAVIAACARAFNEPAGNVSC